jgi:two-component system nitrogen regulation sensor histidine kinase NtrY
MERRHPGARLRSKLVLAFVALSLVDLLLFLVPPVDHQFHRKLVQPPDRSHRESEVAQTYKNSASNALYYAEQISQTIKEQKLLNEENLPALITLIHQKQREYNLGVVEVFSSTNEELVRSLNPQVPPAEFTDPGSDSIRGPAETLYPHQPDR